MSRISKSIMKCDLCFSEEFFDRPVNSWKTITIYDGDTVDDTMDICPTCALNVKYWWKEPEVGTP